MPMSAGNRWYFTTCFVMNTVRLRNDFQETTIDIGGTYKNTSDYANRFRSREKYYRMTECSQ